MFGRVTLVSKIEDQRLTELDLIKGWLRPEMNILEIGGGSGFQASILNSWGCNIISLDLMERNTPKKQYYPIREYDGHSIPLPDNYFDLIFSSNVLEHVHNLPQLFGEMHRVVKPQGLLIHILPSVSWRFWTSLAHYPFLVKYLFMREKSLHSITKTPSIAKALSLRGIKRVLFAGAHGIYHSAFSELYYFSKNHWIKIFNKNGFEIKAIMPNKLFYTGYDLIPSLNIATRKTIAHVLGSACNIFVTKQIDSARSSINNRIDVI